MRLLWLLSLIAWCTWLLSFSAFLTTEKFAHNCKTTFLPGAPKATLELRKLLLPPLVKM